MLATVGLRFSRLTTSRQMDSESHRQVVDRMSRLSRRGLRDAAGRMFGLLLDAPFGSLVERALRRLGGRWPGALPGQSVLLEQLAARHDGTPLVATLSDGVLLSVPAARDGWNFYLRGRLPREDEELTHLLRRFLRHGDVFFDVGANLGYYACTAVRYCGPSGQVHAFEPQAPLVAHIRESLRLNGFQGPQVCHAAVSAQHGGHVTLFLPEDPSRHANASSLFRHEWLAHGSREDVPAVSLDGYLRDRGLARVDLVKVDVEGAELMVLEGLRHTLAHTPPDALVTEVLPQTLSFDDLEAGRALRPDPGTRGAADVAALLAAYGYAPRHIMPDGFMGGPFCLDEMLRVTVPTNVLFVRADIEARRPGIMMSKSE
jgi:FkbM family methyltransferase